MSVEVWVKHSETPELVVEVSAEYEGKGEQFNQAVERSIASDDEYIEEGS